MSSLKNIWTISQYEGKVLWRNWFFRILALAGIIFLTIFNIGVFSEADNPRWYALSNSWIMPYASMILISIPQAAAVIFLATGLVRKDKKLDTNEVFFVRAITNLDYVLGKALALFKLFFLLNLVFIILALIFNLISPFTTFNPAAYVIYPLLTSLPAIVFTTGISFLLVTIIKNQPVTIVLLLGIAAVQLIFYFDQFSNILDFTAFRLPMLSSEISGFADLEFALLQRSFYLLSGIACLFLTAFGMDRLPGHRLGNILTATLGLGLLVISSLVMLRLWDQRQDPLSLRKAMIAVNDRWADKPNVTILENAITLEFLGNELKATSDMRVRNNTTDTLDTIYFTLNNDLTIGEILVNNTPHASNRDLHLVSVHEGIELPPGGEMSVRINYRGTINQAAAHLEVDQERYESAMEYFMFSIQKEYAFLQPGYALLTRDVLWYPTSRVGYSHTHSTSQQLSFTDFELNVMVPDGLMAISQGEPVVNDNTYLFSPEYALPQLSLAIGKYVKKEIEVDEVTYAVYHYPEHDFFADRLNQLSDTLSFLITDLVNEYEDAQKIKYPFRRLQFVEAPIHFTAFTKIYENHQAYLQPETVYYPEEGGNIHQFDFRRQMEYMNRQAANRNQTLSEKQKQANLFNDLIKRVFTRQITEEYVLDGYNVDHPDYAIFPNYYTYNSGIVSQEWTMLNRSIAAYLRNDNQAPIDYSRNINGISFAEECNELMRNASFTEILTDEKFNKIQKSVALKGQYLFSYLSQLTGEEDFKTFLFDWVNRHQHQLTGYQQFREAMLDRFNLDIDPVINKVYFEKSQPAFEILDLQNYEVLDGDRKRFQILAEIKNTGENDGVIEVKFNVEENSDRGIARKISEESANQLPGRITVIKQGERKLLGFILDEKPDNITFNTLISRNIPSVITFPVGPVTRRQGINFFDGERLLSDNEDSNSFEIIVDNEDPEFSSFSPIKPTYLKAFLDKQKKTDQRYYGSWDRSYAKWLATTGSDFYGRVIRSAHFTRSGSGEKQVTWAPDLQKGYYDIYIYMRGKNQNEYVGRDGENRQFYYHYVIEHADGAEDIRFNISTAEPGWNFLGSYYFDAHGGRVLLTDECELRTVYADAVKWVRQ